MNPEQTIAAQQRIIDEQAKLILHLQQEIARLDNPLRGYPAPPPPNPWTQPIQPSVPWTQPPVWCGTYPDAAPVVLYRTTCDGNPETSSPCA